MKTLARATMAVAFAFLGSVVAQAAGQGMGPTVKIGTTGVGLDFTYGLNSKLNLRASGNYFTYSYDDFDLDDEDEVSTTAEDEVEATLDLLTLGAFLDWHPWGGSFRLSAGAFYNGNELTLDAVPGDLIEIGENEYAVQAFNGAVTFDSFAPYLGLGFGNAADTTSRWHFSLDIGVLYTGSPEVDISATASNPTLQERLNADIAVETADLEEDVEPFVVYPVIAVGVSYSF